LQENFLILSQLDHFSPVTPVIFGKKGGKNEKLRLNATTNWDCCTHQNMNLQIELKEP
jgi:hypothetical protein